MTSRPAQAKRALALVGRLGPMAVALVVAACPRAALAQVAEPSPRADDAFDVMNALAERGWHDLRRERWNAYGQVTYIHQYKPSFSAAYTNAGGSTSSLLPEAEHSFTVSATVYAGLALWRGGELYFTPELISLRPLSELKGLGGAIPNFELQKSGSGWPVVYAARLYLRQTIDLGGGPVTRSSQPLQLGGATTARRLVITLGKLSVLDVFDKNSFSGDLRRQFLNMAFLTHMAFDFAADARGYAVGGLLEYIDGGLAIRFARMTPPEHPNQLALEHRLHRFYGDQLEIEYAGAIAGRPGAVRVLGFRNREVMGRFDEALAALRADPGRNAAACEGFHYGSRNPAAPDLCWVRRPNIKMGVGINVEQRISDDLGLFLRGMVSDGKTEVYSYMSADRSLTFGALATGKRWRREQDSLGLGYSLGFISKAHAEYLDAGGVDGFIGDGRLRRASERVFEVFYSAHVLGTVFVSADVQHIANPAFNADRGPVMVLGGRLHAEL